MRVCHASYWVGKSLPLGESRHDVQKNNAEELVIVQMRILLGWVGMMDSQTVAYTGTSVVTAEDYGARREDGMTGFEQSGADGIAGVVLGKAAYAIARELPTSSVFR